jgi:hypothetical protein
VDPRAGLDEVENLKFFKGKKTLVRFIFKRDFLELNFHRSLSFSFSLWSMCLDYFWDSMPLYLFHMNVTVPFTTYNFVFLKNAFNLSLMT